MPRQQDDRGGYWEGATFIYYIRIVNDGSNSGNHEIEISPGVGNELEILYGSIFNGDTAARTILCIIQGQDSSEYSYLLPRNFSLGAGLKVPFPVTDEVEGGGALSGARRLIVSGDMKLYVRIASVGLSQDSEFGVIMRTRGDAPAVTVTSPTGATETVRENRVL
jgi:hypothetical protein